MEFFVTIVKSCKQLSVVTISSTLDVAGVLFPLLTMVLKCTELLKQKRILSDIETNLSVRKILSESLGGNKCEHENIRNDTNNKLSYCYVKK